VVLRRTSSLFSSVFLCLASKIFCIISGETNEIVSRLVFYLPRRMRNHRAQIRPPPKKNNGRTNTNAATSAVLFRSSAQWKKKSISCMQMTRGEKQSDQQWQASHERVIYFLDFRSSVATQNNRKTREILHRSSDLRKTICYCQAPRFLHARDFVCFPKRIELIAS
jgi:hypothetical protein